MGSGGYAQGICAAFGLRLLLAGCAGQLSSLPPLPESEDGAYTLGAGDRLRLQEFGQDELRQEYIVRSEERRGGKECVSTCRSGRSTEHEKKKREKGEAEKR